MTFVRDRAIGDELKLKIVEIVGASAARENSPLVFACLVELALTVAYSTWDAETVADIWDGAIKNVQQSPAAQNPQ